MSEPLTIEISEKNTLHGERHGVPKCVTVHPSGKLYYVDIRAGEVHEYDPRSEQHRSFPAVSPKDGKNEATTAIGLNDDGSLVVARQSGVYYLKPDAPAGQEWAHVCDIPGVSDTVRPNNGTMVKCHDGNTRFFLGTATISGAPEADGSKPGKLFVLAPNQTGKLELQELTKDFVTVNAVSGQVIDDKTHITFADSHKSASVLKTATFEALKGRKPQLGTPTDVVDFKAGETEAKNGRPDGTSAVLFNGRPAVAVAAIDTNEIRVIDLGRKEQVATLKLPEGVHKPTMATFRTSGGKTVAYISTLALPDSTDPRAGKVYVKAMPEQFQAVEAVGNYAAFDRIQAASGTVSAGKFGAVKQA